MSCKFLHRIREYKLYLSMPVLMVVFTIITGFNGLYGQDSYEYVRFANALVKLALHGTNPGKDYWPVLYPVLGILFSVFFKTVFALQFVSILSLIFSGICLVNILKMLYKTADAATIRLFVFSFFLLSPYLLRASLTVMSDSLCLFFITAGYYCFLKYKEEKQNAFFTGFVILASAAISTRYVAFVVLFVPAIVAAYYFFKKFALKPLLLSMIAGTIIFLPYFLIHKSSSGDFLKLWLGNWSFSNFFHSAFTTADGYQTYTFPNIVFCFFNLVHPAYCFAGILFIAAGLKSFNKGRLAGTQWISILSLTMYAFFLAGFPFQDLRHLILSFPFVLILFFPAFIEAFNRINKMKPLIIKLLSGVCLIIQLALFVRVFIPFYHDNKIEKEISSEVVKYGNVTLYTFSIDGAVHYYGFKGEIINMWEVKLDTLPPINKTALVLFNEKQFARVWKNKNPMLNWDYLSSKYHLTKISDLPDDWELFKIRQPR